LGFFRRKENSLDYTATADTFKSGNAVRIVVADVFESSIITKLVGEVFNPLSVLSSFSLKSCVIVKNRSNFWRFRLSTCATK